MRGRTRATAIVAGAVALVLAPAAAFASVAPTDGGDVSYYQGTTSLPDVSGYGFAVVGVNAGRPSDPNESLIDQLTWAQSLAHTDVYVASANPGTASTIWWPGSDTTRAGLEVTPPHAYGTCSSRASTSACAWVYGNSYARDDIAAVASSTTTIVTWWIDVEQDNTWSTSTARNRAVVEGMVAGLQAARKRVGIYALPNQFSDILGTVPSSSSIATLPSWVAGAKDEAAAQQRCTGASLTTGRLNMVQWVDFMNHVDHDVACGTLTQPTPTVSGHHRVGSKLTAKPKTWGPGTVHLTYRWTRDGHPIAKATHSTYTLKRADARHRIGVTVTGTETGYSKAVRRSTAQRVAA